MVWTAFIIGFAGSLHCVGMCSPLSALLGIKGGKLWNRLFYHAGRILVYSFLGSLVALTGWDDSFYSIQVIFSVFAGLLLILMGLGTLPRVSIPWVTAFVVRGVSQLKVFFQQILNRNAKGSVVLLGALNGLLPCGLTYVALSYCLTLQGPLDGFNFMLVFGLGTLPALVGFTSVVQWGVRKWNVSFRGVTMVIMVFLGLLLVARVFFITGHSVQDGRHPAFIEKVICF